MSRNALTQRHTDLRNEFYERVKERGSTPDVEVRLREQIAKLTKTVANNDKELTLATLRRPRAGRRHQSDHHRARRTARGADDAAGRRRPLVSAYRSNAESGTPRRT